MQRFRSHYSAQSAFIVLIDLACLFVGGVIAVTARVGANEFRDYFVGHVDGWIVFFGSVILANYLAGSYTLQNTFSRFNLLVTWAFSLLFALIVLSITSYAWFTVLLGRGVLVLWVVAYSLVSIFLKMLVYRDLFRSPMFLCKVVVLGHGPRAIEIRRMLENPFVMPSHKVVAFVRLQDWSSSDAAESAIDDVPVLECSSADLHEVLRPLGVNLLTIGFENVSRLSELYPLLRRLRFEGVEIMNPLSVAELYAGRTPLDLVNEEALTQASLESDLPLVDRAKRLLDILISLVACLFFFLPVLLISLLTKLNDPKSPVFYTQTRVGRFGKPFKIYKFRTMKHGAETETGPVWAKRNDPRITPVGRILRRYRLDEIPQVINILHGDMSVVGPRPERPAICAELAKQIPFYAERENVLPGLTGWAQVRHPYGNTIEDARRKLEYDLYYIKHVSLSLDLQIILSTMRIVLMGDRMGL